MQAILAVTVPFFALIGLGWLGARRGVLPESAIPGLNAYVLFFALPCMLFRFGSSLPVGRLIDASLLAVYTVSGLLVVALTIAVTRRRAGARGGVDLNDAAFGALVAAFPNSGFMGVPLLAALLGEAAAGPVIGSLLVDLVVTSTLCLAIAQAGAHGAVSRADASVLAGMRRALRGAASNPLPWAIALGALAAATGVQPAAPFAQLVRLLGDSASPVALFTIGAVLWRAGMHAHARTPVGRYVPVAFIKLVVHPALVFAIGHVALALGAPVGRAGLTALVLAAALPSASNVSLLAEHYGADNGRVARIVMASTVAAFATFPLLALLILSRSPVRPG